MTEFAYDMAPTPPRFGLVVLQSDETIERDFAAMTHGAEVLASRVPSGAEVTRETLASMEGHLTAAASLFPTTFTMNAIAYGCTSGTAEIGADTIAGLVKSGHATPDVTDPLTALIAACQHLGITELAVLSPYIQSVSANLCACLNAAGINTPTFGTFAEAEEAKVVRISRTSLGEAAHALMADSPAQALFLSCTNLRTLDVIEDLETDLNLPVLSSNQVLAWHMGQLSNQPDAFKGPGRIFSSAR